MRLAGSDLTKKGAFYCHIMLVAAYTGYFKTR
jgi:hypothetical protein